MPAKRDSRRTTLLVCTAPRYIAGHRAVPCLRHRRWGHQLHRARTRYVLPRPASRRERHLPRGVVRRVVAGPPARGRGEELRAARSPDARRTATHGPVLGDGPGRRADGPDRRGARRRRGGRPADRGRAGDDDGRGPAPGRPAEDVDRRRSAGRASVAHPQGGLDAPAHPCRARRGGPGDGAHPAGRVRRRELRHRLRGRPHPCRKGRRGRDRGGGAPPGAAVQRVRPPRRHGAREVPAL